MPASLELLLTNIRLADVFDIGVVAILIYLALLWFTERASRSVGIFLALLLSLYVAARWLEMYLTTMMFELGVIGVVIALVIVFQQDIRSGFERLAASKWLSRTIETQPSIRVVDTLSEAISVMASECMGALIVLPGLEPLDRHVHGGEVVDARLSLPLIHSIFHPHSLGHDGAVMIEGDRIERLGVHLPLTRDLAKIDGGTRHAAAMGLAERSDALVIVVSEERGTITIAHNGKCEIVAPNELIDRLQGWYQDRQPVSAMTTRNRVRGLGLKLAAIGLAMALWFSFAYHTDLIQRSIVVPIEYRNVPKGKIVDEPRATHAELLLSGTEGAFKTLEPTALVVSFDLATFAETEESPYRTPTRQSLMNVPDELEVEQITPSHVWIHVREK